MGTVLGYLRPHARRVACGVTVKFTAALLELALPLLLEYIIRVCVPARDLPAIWRCGGMMAALAFGAAACNIIANRMAAWVSMEVTRSLRRDLYSRVEQLSCAQMDRFSTSSLVSRLTNDTYHVHQMFDKVQRGGIRAPMLVAGGLALTFLLEPALAVIQLAVSLLTFLAIWQVTRRGIPHYAKAQAATDTVVRIIRENASGVRVIKALAGQGRERQRFQTVNEDARRKEEAAGCVMAAANPLTDFLLNTGLVLVVLVGAVRVAAGEMYSHRIVTFLSYFALIQTATLGIAKGPLAWRRRTPGSRMVLRLSAPYPAALRSHRSGSASPPRSRPHSWRWGNRNRPIKRNRSSSRSEACSRAARPPG